MKNWEIFSLADGRMADGGRRLVFCYFNLVEDALVLKILQ